MNLQIDRRGDTRTKSPIVKVLADVPGGGTIDISYLKQGSVIPAGTFFMFDDETGLYIPSIGATTVVVDKIKGKSCFVKPFGGVPIKKYDAFEFVAITIGGDYYNFHISEDGVLEVNQNSIVKNDVGDKIDCLFNIKRPEDPENPMDEHPSRNTFVSLDDVIVKDNTFVALGFSNSVVLNGEMDFFIEKMQLSLYSAARVPMTPCKSIEKRTLENRLDVTLEAQ